MYISTRGCYAIMALVDLQTTQKHYGFQRPVALGEMAERLHISISYLEQIFAKLRSSGVVRSVRGPGGGYVLAKSADAVTLAEIVNCVSMPLVDKMCQSTVSSRRDEQTQADCPSKPLWESLGDHIQEYMQRVDLGMVVDGKVDLFPKLEISA